ncbi:MAG: hypothetical protein IJZ32_00895 [Clostridia bacterium]|nr:hypothetical protein [Clostridia bacterium]
MDGIVSGALYKTVEIDGVRFDIYYGFYNEREKELGYEPTPVYPNFDKNPQYTKNGELVVAVYKDLCEHYKPLPKTIELDGCVNCVHFDRREEYIGLCKCEHCKKADENPERQNE